MSAHEVSLRLDDKGLPHVSVDGGPNLASKLTAVRLEVAGRGELSRVELDLAPRRVEVDLPADVVLDARWQAARVVRAMDSASIMEEAMTHQALEGCSVAESLLVTVARHLENE